MKIFRPPQPPRNRRSELTVLIKTSATRRTKRAEKGAVPYSAVVAEPTFLQTPQREVEEDARRGEAEEHVVDGEAFLHEKLGEVKEREDQENRDQTVFFSCRRTFQRENSSTGLLQALNFGKKGGNVPTPAAVPFGELAREKLFFGRHDSFVAERKGEHKEEHEAGSAVRRTIPSEMRRLPK